MTTIDATDEQGERIRIHIDGAIIRAIYSDALIDMLNALGDLVVRRASFVEPCRHWGWQANMSPMNGPMLGPFRTRQEALTAERDWLRNERGL